jgi:hypothetical protein
MTAMTIIIVALALLAAGAAAPVQEPPRDRPAPAARAGSGVIAGRVTVFGSRPLAPVRRAKVTLESPVLTQPQTVDADTEGRYRFDALPAGEYRIIAAKPGFVTLEHGATRAFQTPDPIRVTDGEKVSADIALPRGAAIEGRILNEDGEPVQNVLVSVVKTAFGATGRRPIAVRQARTDDLGRYRIHSLPSGEYQVDVAPDPEAIGEAVVPGARPPGIARTYYPGTPRLHEARRVSLSTGQNVPDISFTATRAALASVTTLVLDSSGKPVTRPGVRIQRVGAAPGEVRGFVGRTAGSSVFPSVPPGEYWVMAAHAPAGGTAEFGAARLTVAGQDIPDFTLATTPGAQIDGIVEVEGGDPLPAALRIVTIETEYETPNPRHGAPPEAVRVGSDGSFRIAGIAGPRLVRLSGLPPAWALKSVTLASADITDAVTDFTGGNAPRPMRLVVTNQTGSVSVAATDARNRPRPRMRVVVFAADDRRWGASSRFVKAALSRADGTATIDGLLPGRYLVTVVDHLDDGSWLDPEVLGRLRSDATAIEVASGQTQKLTVKARGQS